jgi:hypothetical protein
MPTDEEVIDLTFSEDEGDDQPDYSRKRRRYDDDDDIILVEDDVVAQLNNEPETANPVDDDEVMIVSTNGGEVCDYNWRRNSRTAVQCTLRSNSWLN